MRLPPLPNRWNVTPKRAIAIQKMLADRVRIEPLAVPVRLVAGADVTYATAKEACIAGIVVWDIERREVIETVVARRRSEFPYVPGLLSFREVPVVLAAVRRLKNTPDVFMLDAQGFAHPRRFGLACHFGVCVDRPSIGCAKSRLCGDHEGPASRRGARAPLMLDGEAIGTVLRTRDGVKCVYVSIGHRVTLDDAVRVVLACSGGYRLPEPTRLAHQLVTRERWVR
jgi:deoxyribonuclease V